MAIVEAQVPLPVPPTGVDEHSTLHEFNPESGHYEPPLKNGVLNASLLSPLVAAAFIAVTAAARPWIYYLTLANVAGAVVTVTLAEPGGNTLIVQVPANDTVILRSTPDAPIFVSRTVGNITLLGTIATVQVTATYTNK